MSAPEPADPFAGALTPGRYGVRTDAPARIAVRRCSLVQASARRGQADAMAAAVRAQFGLDLPPPGRASASGELAALWLQPECWMFMRPGRDDSFALALKTACDSAASVVDQTHGQVVLNLSGAAARDVLARLCRIDLHPRAFGPGRVAATAIAELACLLHQRDDAPSFDVILPTSYAGWFLEALTHAAAAVGYEVPDAGPLAKLRAGAL
ncbi:MAG TPA: sarcosine oxidase subunit gamma family protein [Acetobacteraceae bacterium]|nr:sarcosine oxidase subunit gamma family protein [Acetobacteraceae bacterium]